MTDKLSPLPIIPSDSSLHHWMAQWSFTEVYPSWRIATALAIYGAVLRRNVGFGLGEVGHIWPNTSILLVGPSGDGKDTIINPAVELLTETLPIECRVPLVAGRTIEAIKESIFGLGNPAVGVLHASELSALLGQKDYQQGIVTDLTDILTSAKSVDITLKSTGRRKLPNPTLSMFAGSTRDWLLTMLPEGSLDGGFLPRFIIVPERSKKEAGVRFAPNPGRLSKRDIEYIEGAKLSFENAVITCAVEYEQRRTVNISKKTGQPTAVSIIESEEAAQWFENWYENRHKGFKSILQAFANRSPQLLRKLAMLMAITRGHNWIELTDYEFAGGFIHYIAARLEASVIPVCREVVAGFSIMDMLPAREAEILKELGGKFGPKSVKDGISHLVNTEQIRNEKGVLVKIHKEIDG